MVDQKQIAGIFNDFLGLYLGKSADGICTLCEKYENHNMLLGLLSNLDEASKLPVPKVMKETYEFYKKYRGRVLNEEEWQAVVNDVTLIYMQWDSNPWCNRILIELMTLLEADEKEQKKENIKEEMKAA